MKKSLGLALLLTGATVSASPNGKWLTVDNDILAKIRPQMNKSLNVAFSGQGASVVNLSDKEVEKLSHVIHNELHRCGGFIAHDSFEEASEAISSQGEMYFAKRALFAD